MSETNGVRNWLRGFTVPKGLTRDGKLLYVSAFANGVNFGLFFVVIQFYLIQLGFLGEAIGTIGSLLGIASTIFTIPAGVIADVTGRKKNVIFGYLLLGGAVVSVAFTRDFFLLALESFLGGVGSSFIFSSWGALLAGSLPRESLEQGFSFSYFVTTFASALGGSLASLPNILSAYGFTALDGLRVAVLLSAALTFIAIIPVSLLKTGALSQGVLRFRLPSRGIISKFMAVNVFIGFGAGLTIPLFPLFYARKFQIDSGVYGLLSAAASLIGSLFFFLGPRISARLGPFRTIAVSSAASIPLLILIPLMPSFLFTVPLFILRQSLIFMGAPLAESSLMRLVQEGERATAAGVSQVSWSLPNSLGQPIGGAIMDKNVNLPPFLTAGFYSVYSLLWVLIFRNVDLKRN